MAGDIKPKDFDYARKTAELEAVLERLQADGVSLDEALKLHQKGVGLVAEIEGYLKEADLMVRKQLAKD